MSEALLYVNQGKTPLLPSLPARRIGPPTPQSRSSSGAGIDSQCRQCAVAAKHHMINGQSRSAFQICLLAVVCKGRQSRLVVETPWAMTQSYHPRPRQTQILLPASYPIVNTRKGTPALSPPHKHIQRHAHRSQKDLISCHRPSPPYLTSTPPPLRHPLHLRQRRRFWYKDRQA